VTVHVLLLIALLGPVFYDRDPTAIDTTAGVMHPAPPSDAFPLGTDDQGRDLLARLLMGARISLAVGIVSCLINVVIGIGVGVTAGWAYSANTNFGRWMDSVIMRGVDILYSIPLLLVVILLQVFVRRPLELLLGGRNDLPVLLSPDLISVYVALGVTNWLTMARLTRSEVINQAGQEYVMAAPHSKLLTFGGDYGPVERVPGHAAVARKGLAQAIRELVEDGWVKDSEVPDLVDRIMRGNAHEIFDYEGTLAAWDKAA